MSRAPLENENNLLSKIKNSDMAAFETVFRHYHKALWLYAREILKDEDEAEDTVQNLFLTLWERRKELLITTSLKSYLFTAVRNQCLKKLGKASRSVLLDTDEEHDTPAHQNTSSRVQEKDLKQAIEKAIANLPERCRLVFKLSRFGHLSYQEIATELDISVKTVENQISKALAVLRDSLRYHLVLFLLLYFST